MAPESISLLDRARPSPVPPPLDWLTLADAFEVACLVRCTPPPASEGRRPEIGTYRGGMAEFNRADAARRMRQLLGRLDVPVEHELATGGLRRRYELHRLYVPREHRSTYAALLETDRLATVLDALLTLARAEREENQRVTVDAA
ncbi:hypothetical protein ACWEVO_36060, partial [Micromonospora sp. NPDC003776]